MRMRIAAATTVVSFGILGIFLVYWWPGRQANPPAREKPSTSSADSAVDLPRLDHQDWRALIRKRLQRKVSFEFVETPLSEALQFLQALMQVNIILDPKAFETGGDPTMPITLRVTDMKVGTALGWILRLADLEYAIMDEAIFVSAPYNLARNVLLKVYDVSDLAMRIPDYRYPIFPSDASDKQVATGFNTMTIMEDPEMDASFLAEFISTRIRPETWAQELGTSIEVWHDRLIINCRPEVHDEIAASLARLRRELFRQIRVELRLVAIDETLLARIQDLQAIGDRTIFLRKTQLDLLNQALKTGKQATLVKGAEIICHNAQRTHLTFGKVKETVKSDGEIQYGWRGLSFDVRPVAGFERKYITMNLCLALIMGEPDPSAAPDDFRFSTTSTCLDGDTILVAGWPYPGQGTPRRLVALVTPSLLRLPQDQQTAQASSPAP